MTRLAMRPAKSFWKKRPALAHHMPMALPADQVGEPRRDRLVGDQVLQQQRGGPHDQQHQRHAERAGCPVAEQRPGPWLETSATMRPMKTGIVGVERATSEPGDEQRHDQPAAPGARNASRNAAGRAPRRGPAAAASGGMSVGRSSCWNSAKRGATRGARGGRRQLSHGSPARAAIHPAFCVIYETS